MRRYGCVSKGIGGGGHVGPPLRRPWAAGGFSVGRRKTAHVPAQFLALLWPERVVYVGQPLRLSFDGRLRAGPTCLSPAYVFPYVLLAKRPGRHVRRHDDLVQTDFLVLVPH